MEERAAARGKKYGDHGGKPEKWIAGAVGKHPGKLHRELHVPEGQKIPEKKMAKAAKSDNPTIRREVALAKTLKGMNHG